MFELGGVFYSRSQFCALPLFFGFADGRFSQKLSSLAYKQGQFLLDSFGGAFMKRVTLGVRSLKFEPWRKDRSPSPALIWFRVAAGGDEEPASPD